MQQLQNVSLMCYNYDWFYHLQSLFTLKDPQGSSDKANKKVIMKWYCSYNNLVTIARASNQQFKNKFNLAKKVLA